MAANLERLSQYHKDRGNQPWANLYKTLAKEERAMGTPEDLGSVPESPGYVSDITEEAQQVGINILRKEEARRYMFERREVELEGILADKSISYHQRANARNYLDRLRDTGADSVFLLRFSSVGPRNKLLRHGIDRINQLRALIQEGPLEESVRLRHIGPKTSAQIREALEEFDREVEEVSTQKPQTKPYFKEIDIIPSGLTLPSSK